MPMPNSNVTTLCLIRHGETQWNADGRIQGQLDVPLSDIGLAQARAVAKALATESFDVIYASDLMRVRQTAEPMAAQLALSVRLNAALRERHYGIFETLTYDEAKIRHAEFFARFNARDPDFDFVTGEGLRDFSARAIACFNEIVNAHRGERVLIFTHGGVLEMIYRHVNRLGLSAPREFGIPNAALNWIEAADDESKVLIWADAAHLDSALNELPN
jgi:2,3-bisphosphoglycerate-dependent phosphoglycerate mutase